MMRNPRVGQGLALGTHAEHHFGTGTQRQRHPDPFGRPSRTNGAYSALLVPCPLEKTSRPY